MTRCTEMEGLFSEEIERRAQILAATARRTIDTFEDPSEYCHPACPRCALELARANLEGQHGWACCDAARAITDSAAELAAQWLRVATVTDRIR